MQLDWPTDPWYDPAPQTMHWFAAVLSVAALYLPAGQLVQAAWAVLAWYRPVSQTMHCPEEAEPLFPLVPARYRPVLQSMQLDEAAVAWTRPAALKDDPHLHVRSRLEPIRLQVVGKAGGEELRVGEPSPGDALVGGGACLAAAVASGTACDAGRGR